MFKACNIRIIVSIKPLIKYLSKCSYIKPYCIHITNNSPALLLSDTCPDTSQQDDHIILEKEKKNAHIHSYTYQIRVIDPFSI